MNLALRMGLSSSSGAGAAQPYASYATYLDFKNQLYAYQGTTYALASLPGYAVSSAPTLDANGLVVTSNKTLAASVNPVTSDQDYVIWAVINYPATNSGTSEVIFDQGTQANQWVRRAGSNSFDSFFHGGNYSVAGNLATGRAVIMQRRRGGKDTFAHKLTSTVTIGTESAATTFGATDSTLNIGNLTGAGFPAMGTIEFVGIRLGTFSDADLTTILTAA